MNETNSQICQWCLSEIIWDEEVGPESHCPHCDNELANYRTMKIGIERDEDEDGVSLNDDLADEDWEDEEEAPDTSWMNDENGFRGGNRTMLAAEGVIQRIIDDQLEVPECPACREYMIEAGVQTIGSNGFTATESPAIGIAVVGNSFNMIWYVCPACYHTASFLSKSDREDMLNRLSERS